MDDPDAEEREAAHWRDVCRALLSYEDFLGDEVLRRQRHLNRLSDRHAALLPSSTFERVAATVNAARCNQEMLQDMVSQYIHKMTRRGDPVLLPRKDEGPPIYATQLHRTEAILHSLHREWTADGRKEREAIFEPLLDALQRYLPVKSPDVAFRQRVLVPGCGTGRLPLEVAIRGYAAEANEFSAFMLIAADFVLNGLDRPEQLHFYPFVNTVCNVVAAAAPTVPHLLPDVSAYEALLDSPHFQQKQQADDEARRARASARAQAESQGGAAAAAAGEYSDDEDEDECCWECRSAAGTSAQWRQIPALPPLGMSSGDFVQLFGPATPAAAGSYDCVLTCFFVDTAPNVIDYLDTIFHALRPGGYWINLGPLLYHWTNDSESNGDERFDQSIELSYEELKHVVRGVGLRFVEERRVPCTYTRNTRSIMHNVFDALFFVCRKPAQPKHKARFQPPAPPPRLQRQQRQQAASAAAGGSA